MSPYPFLESNTSPRKYVNYRERQVSSEGGLMSRWVLMLLLTSTIAVVTVTSVFCVGRATTCEAMRRAPVTLAFKPRIYLGEKGSERGTASIHQWEAKFSCSRSSSE